MNVSLFGFGLEAIIMAIIMVLALIGMIVCAKKQEMIPAAKPAAIVCMVVIIACAFGILTTTGMFGDGGAKKMIANEMVYSHASAYISGKYIGEKYPGAKILLLVDDETNNIRQAEMIEHLKRGLGDRCEIVGMECPKPLLPPPPEEEAVAAVEGAAEGTDAAASQQLYRGMMEMMVPIQEIMTAQLVTDAIAKYPDVTMLVTFVGLPRNFQEMDIWHEEDETKMLKVALISGQIYQLGPEIQSGQIVAAVTHNPGAKYDESKAPLDPQAAFDKRYLLITPENIAEIAQKYPGLFEVQQ